RNTDCAAESTRIAQLDLFGIETPKQHLLLASHRDRWPAASAGYFRFEPEPHIQIGVVAIPAAFDLHPTERHHVAFRIVLGGVPVEFGGRWGRAIDCEMPRRRVVDDVPVAECQDA